jgi:predicted phage tail protein
VLRRLVYLVLRPLLPFTVVATIGFSLACLGGVAQLISPMPSLGSFTSGKKRHGLSHFRLAELSTPAKQGMAVPICYGRAFVGSAVISSGLDVDQVAV